VKRRDRDALLLHVWGDLTYDEIAAALEIPIGTVRSRINRARRQLREILALEPGPQLITEGRYDRA
jgi:RNA polymerase sigma factor (sigma-70 family)